VRSDEAKSLLKKNWGIDGEISSLPSERDINFKISGKVNCVLKIYPKVDSTLKIRLNLQNKVLKFLEEKRLTTSPFVVPTKSKKLLINPSKGSAARVLTFHEGSAWGAKTSHSGEEIEQLGRNLCHHLIYRLTEPIKSPHIFSKA
jgi:Ser/Thr protein kinase RdoA (MazF antagonist)